jgi:hypothetical protein
MSMQTVHKACKISALVDRDDLVDQIASLEDLNDPKRLDASGAIISLRVCSVSCIPASNGSRPGPTPQRSTFPNRWEGQDSQPNCLWFAGQDKATAWWGNLRWATSRSVRSNAQVSAGIDKRFTCGSYTLRSFGHVALPSLSCFSRPSPSRRDR